VVVSNSNQQLGGGGGWRPVDAEPDLAEHVRPWAVRADERCVLGEGLPDAGTRGLQKGTDYEYQVARSGSGNFATFTQTGTPGLDSPAGTMINVNDNAWHHYARSGTALPEPPTLCLMALWTPDQSYRRLWPELNVASFEYLVLAARPGRVGKLHSLPARRCAHLPRALSQAEVLALLPDWAAPDVAGRNTGRAACASPALRDLRLHAQTSAADRRLE